MRGSLPARTTNEDLEQNALKYDIDDEHHKICFAAAGKDRPKAFSSMPGSGEKMKADDALESEKHQFAMANLDGFFLAVELNQRMSSWNRPRQKDDAVISGGLMKDSSSWRKVFHRNLRVDLMPDGWD